MSVKSKDTSERYFRPTVPPIPFFPIPMSPEPITLWPHVEAIIDPRSPPYPSVLHSHTFSLLKISYKRNMVFGCAGSLKIVLLIGKCIQLMSAVKLYTWRLHKTFVALYVKILVMVGVYTCCFSWRSGVGILTISVCSKQGWKTDITVVDMITMYLHIQCTTNRISVHLPLSTFHDLL